jgi:hypothetical protein
MIDFLSPVFYLCVLGLNGGWKPRSIAAHRMEILGDQLFYAAFLFVLSLKVNMKSNATAAAKIAGVQ